MGQEADYLIDQNFDRKHGEYGDTYYVAPTDCVKCGKPHRLTALDAGTEREVARLCVACFRTANPKVQTEPRSGGDSLEPVVGHPVSVLCPHGKKQGECDSCDFLADVAYDTARENRHFGR